MTNKIKFNFFQFPKANLTLYSLSIQLNFISREVEDLYPLIHTFWILGTHGTHLTFAVPDSI